MLNKEIVGTVNRGAVLPRIDPGETFKYSVPSVGSTRIRTNNVLLLL